MNAVEQIMPSYIYGWSAHDIVLVITNSPRYIENILEKLSQMQKGLTKCKIVCGCLLITRISTSKTSLYVLNIHKI